MTDQTPAPVEPSVEPAASVEPKTNSVSYDSHRKLLGEKKAIQTELQELRAADELRKQEKLQANGKQDEVIAALREEIAKTKNEYKETTDKVAFDKFKGQCVNAAKEMNVVDTEWLMTKMSKERMASIQIDDRLQANADDMKRVLEEIKSETPNLFGASSVNHNPVTMTGFRKNETKGVNDMSKADIVAALNNL